MKLVEELLSGSRRALSRAITIVENQYDEATELMQLLYPHSGRAYVIGITGPPGAGKSTLMDKLVKELRSRGKTVGVVAIDPTSPFTGGAILGDRIRMQDLTMDENVFIRSMGTRGSLGGLATATAAVIKIMDAFGKDIVLVETVGVGQSEVDIVKAADSTCVVMVPGLGDDIQAIKAGILEIADVFVINKADREGAQRVLIELEMMMDMSESKKDWRPPVKKTVAEQNQGIIELVDALFSHKHYMEQGGELERRRTERTKTELLALLDQTIHNQVLTRVNQQGQFEKMVVDVAQRRKTPQEVVSGLLHPLLREWQMTPDKGGKQQ